MAIVTPSRHMETLILAIVRNVRRRLRQQLFKTRGRNRNMRILFRLRVPEAPCCGTGGVPSGSACQHSVGGEKKPVGRRKRLPHFGFARQWRSLMTPDPRTIYTQRLAERHAEIAHQEKHHRTLGHGKLAMASCGVALVWLALARDAFSILWVLIPVAGFALLVVIHEKLLKVLERRRRAARFFEKALARLDGNWAGTGEAGDRYSEAAHPYALDLDLFGKGSVFQLLCTARTRIGEDRLAQWLKSPAEPEVVRARHRAVEELRERVDLREELAIVAEEARSGVDPVHLAHWGEAPAALRKTGYRLRVRLHTVLGLAGFAALWIHLLRSANLIALPDGVDALVRDLFLVALVVNGWFLYRQSGVLGAAVSAVEEAAHELGLLA